MSDSCSASADHQRQQIHVRASKIKLLLLDVDGVLTDGTLLYSGNGEESKSFHTRDGFGIRLLHEVGIDTGVITARKSAVVKRRAEELKMRFIRQAAVNKEIAFGEIMAESELLPSQVAYMGDDWLDLVVLLRVGLAVSPANGVSEVKEAAHYITEHKGGDGAVRECCDLILKAQQLLPNLLRKYMVK